MSPRPRAERGRRRTGPLRVLGWMALLLGSLFLVTWRQTRGIAMEREIRELETEMAIVGTERVELMRRIEELRSRSRIVRVARERLGMHLPEDGEIVFLPVSARSEGQSAPEAKR